MRARRASAVEVSGKKAEKGHGLVVLLTPEISVQGERDIIREGCLSVPDYTGNVLRY
ncbi:MAG: peptide deformylase, partial [Nitrospinota bacterium]